METISTVGKADADKILSFIASIRNSFEGSERVYTNGSCYQFYKILKQVFPDAEAYYDSYHVITEIGGRYYDITGEVERTRHLLMSEHYPNSGVIECKYSGICTSWLSGLSKRRR